MELLTTISSEYVKNWGFYEGIRELMQNGLDAKDKGFNFETVYVRDNKELYLYNEGTSLTRSNLLLGSTSKEGDETQRGMWGEGFKIGILALLRQGKDVFISNGIQNEIIIPSIKYHPDYGNTPVLCFTVEKTDSILPVDKKKLLFKISNVSPVEIAKIKIKFLHWDGLELGEYYKTSDGKILTADKYKGMIFCKGIYVCNLEKLSYGYDLDYVQLGRDRDLASEFDVCWTTSKMWAQVSKVHGRDKLVIDLLKSGARDIEYINSNSNSNIEKSVIEEFKSSSNSNSYPCSNEYDRKKIVSIGMTPVFVKEQHNELIRKSLPSLYKLVEKAEKVKYNEYDITGIFSNLIANGWKIEYNPCSCGGKYSWMKPNELGEYKNAGCICHNTPLN